MSRRARAAGRGGLERLADVGGRGGVVEGSSRGCGHPHAHTHAHAHVCVRHDGLMQRTPISRRGWLP
jgi:hypothetical protein